MSEGSSPPTISSDKASGSLRRVADSTSEVPDTTCAQNKEMSVSVNVTADNNVQRESADMIISPMKTNDTNNNNSSAAIGTVGVGMETAAPNLQHTQPLSQQQQVVGDMFAASTAQQQNQLYLQNINPYASILHPMLLSQLAMMHPQYQQMTPEQQQMFLFQQQLIMQQIAAQQTNIQHQLLQQQQQQQQQQTRQQFQAPVATVAVSSQYNQPHLSQSQQLHSQQESQGFAAAADSQAQHNVYIQHMAQAQQILLQQQIMAAQQHNHSAAAVASSSSSSQDQYSQQQASATSAAPLSAAQHVQNNIQQQINNKNNSNNNNDNLSFQQQALLQGISASDIEEIYQADESFNYQQPHPTPQNNHHTDSDDDDDEDGYTYSYCGGPSRRLLRLVEDHRWVAALQRIIRYPRETQQVGIQGRTPLHVACDHDAPAALVQAILRAWPEGANRVGTSHMNPLHITCSSPHASVEVVRVLLSGCRDPMMITSAKDVDGDTPLHAACRCAAPMDVLITLLQANPITVTWKDYEGLNPLMRLWVRYFVLVGEKIISNITKPSDVNGELIEAWQKSLLLLQVMDAMEKRGGGQGASEQQERSRHPFHIVHAASSVDCPRCVVRIAMVLFPQELLRRDEHNRLPIHIAAAAPVYAVNDLRGEGFSLDDAYIDDENPHRRANVKPKKQTKYKEPSVINILLGGDPTAARERDQHGQLPLHVAIMRGKTLEEGVQALVEANPDALTTPDAQTNLYPFMLAASVGRGRGDCSTIYALLRAAPDLVHLATDGVSLSPPGDDGKEELAAVHSEGAEEEEELDDRKPAAVPVGGEEGEEDLDRKPAAKPDT